MSLYIIGFFLFIILLLVGVFIFYYKLKKKKSEKLKNETWADGLDATDFGDSSLDTIDFD